MASLLVTVEEAARRLGVGRTTAYALVVRGDIPSVRIGRARRVAVRDLEAFVERLRGTQPDDAHPVGA